MISPFLHQPFHLAHLALEEAVDADLAAVGVWSIYKRRQKMCTFAPDKRIKENETK